MTKFTITRYFDDSTFQKTVVYAENESRARFYAGMKWEEKDYNKTKEYDCTIESEGIKYDSNKLRYGLLLKDLVKQVEEVVKVLTHGAEKYKPRGWQDVSTERYEDALGRHYAAMMKGERLDKESGMHHGAHMICNILFMMFKESK